MSTLPSDTALLDAMITHEWSIDAPCPPESNTWVVYDEKNAFYDGLACSRDLRQALIMAYAKTYTPPQ